MSRRVMALVMKAICVCAAVLAGTAGVSVSYGDIIQHGGGQTVFWPFGPTVVGQTFTADNTVTSLDSIGFFYAPGNESRPDAQPTLTLYQGAGYGGAVLGSQGLGPIPGSSSAHWEDANFSGVTLVSGQVYTFKLAQTTDASGGFRMWGDFDNDIYTNGQYLDASGNPLTHAYFDLDFRVLGVPEPATLSLLALGGLALTRRRRTA